VEIRRILKSKLIDICSPKAGGAATALALPRMWSIVRGKGSTTKALTIDFRADLPLQASEFADARSGTALQADQSPERPYSLFLQARRTER